MKRTLQASATEMVIDLTNELNLNESQQTKATAYYMEVLELVQKLKNNPELSDVEKQQKIEEQMDKFENQIEYMLTNKQIKLNRRTKKRKANIKRKLQESW